MTNSGKGLTVQCPGGSRALVGKVYTDDPGITAIHCPVCGADVPPGKQVILEDGQVFRTTAVREGSPFYFVLPAHLIDVIVA